MWKYPFLLIWQCLACLILEVEAVRQHYVHWNTSNSLFFNTNVIDITSSATKSDQASEAWDYEQANIICPLYDNGIPRTLTEQYVVYNVTKRDYDKCQLSSNNAKIVALCNTPYTPKFFTLTFRSFSPTPGAFEFHPGQKYYFIATNYLDNNNHSGHQRSSTSSSKPKCSHPPMRLIFRIKDDTTSKRDGAAGDANVDGTAQPVNYVDDENTIGMPREMPMQTRIHSGSSRIQLPSTFSQKTLLLIMIFKAFLI